MKVISLQDSYRQPVCLALGFFDCVHIGHRCLIEKAIERAAKTGSRAGVVTFSENPFAALHRADKLILTYRERLSVLASLNLDFVLSLPFDAAFRQKTSDEFLALLQNSLCLRGLVCGYDYRFGADKAGNSAVLQDFCAKNDIMCDIVPPVCRDGVRISSTLVRKAVESGDVAEAARLMGHPYFIDGTVCHGRGVGKTFAFPTANLSHGADKLLPKEGVYATLATVDGREYAGVTNVGTKPTFGDDNTTVETMLLDFDGDLYEKEMRLTFVRRLRDIRKFSSPQELGAQIAADAKWRNNE